jgi:hypothetical protein
MDLPHYHGLSASLPALIDKPPGSDVKEVTGA